MKCKQIPDSANVLLRFKENDGSSFQVSGNSVKYSSKKVTSIFDFDSIHVEKNQTEMYQALELSTIKKLFSGQNGSILAYGQTNSGKTYTLFGDNIRNKVTRGIMPRACETIIEQISLRREKNPEISFELNLSMIEIYLGKIQNLLNTDENNLKIHENSQKKPYLKLSSKSVTNLEEILNYIEIGLKNRHSLTTDSNQQSSRSHLICTITFALKDKNQLTLSPVTLTLIDLAGSEKVSKSKIFNETKDINSSLSTLRHVMSSLASKTKHVPYRDSKLTRILQQIFTNSKVTFIANCIASNITETLSTLQFAAKIKKIKIQLNKSSDLKDVNDSISSQVTIDSNILGSISTQQSEFIDEFNNKDVKYYFKSYQKFLSQYYDLAKDNLKQRQIANFLLIEVSRFLIFKENTKQFNKLQLFKEFYQQEIEITPEETKFQRDFEDFLKQSSSKTLSKPEQMNEFLNFLQNFEN